MRRKQAAKKNRKIPVQSRSRATVDAIIQATTYILTEVGWGGLTTNAIAERAGVNIASLYQFFSNKEAIIAELQKRHADAVHADLHKALLQLPDQPSLRKAIASIIEMIVNEHRIAPAVQRAIDELPLTLRYFPDEDAELHGHLLNAVKPFMKNVPDPDLTIYLIGIAAYAIIHRITAERPQLLDHPGLVTELVTLFERYLSRPAALGPKRKHTS